MSKDSDIKAPPGLDKVVKKLLDTPPKPKTGKKTERGDDHRPPKKG